MGRTFPNGDNYANIFHPLISTSFFIACIAATFAIITSLCGFSRRKTTPPPQNTPQAETTTASSDNDTTQQPQYQSVAAAAAVSDDATQQPQSDINDPQPLPPPPGRHQLSGAASYHMRSDSAASSHTTSAVGTTNQSSSRSMSMRLNGIGLMSSKHLLGSKREDHHKKEKNLKHEDSIWKKTIILGDKCRVPDEDDDDAIVYDEKGNRISTYHRKHTNSMALSRQGSSIDQDAIPKHDDHIHMIDDESRNIKVGGGDNM